MRVLCGVALVMLLVGPAFGQVQGYALEPTAPSAPVQGYPVGPPVAVPSPTAAVPVEGPFVPLSAAPPCVREPGPVANGFQLRTAGGRLIESFPQTLLWEPPLANLREPRILLMPNTLSTPFTEDTLDTAIGGTVGLLRVGPEDAERRFQLDVFAVVATRISQYDYLVSSDYRAGLPFTYACGPWHAKLGYEHTSTHLGDETIARTNRAPIDAIRDEITFGLGRWLFRDSLRLYGQAAWAFFIDVPGDPSPFRFDTGFEWYHRRATGFRGQPFAAGNVEFNGATSYQPNVSLQLGWQWRDPSRRFSQMRVFAQYYTGRSIYGQFFDEREQWFGTGIAFDY